MLETATKKQYQKLKTDSTRRFRFLYTETKNQILRLKPEILEMIQRIKARNSYYFTFQFPVLEIQDIYT